MTIPFKYRPRLLKIEEQAKKEMNENGKLGDNTLSEIYKLNHDLCFEEIKNMTL